jgi:hypothetical protein
MYDPLRFAIAMIPIAAYLIVIGLLRYRSHPTVISRSLDIMMLGFACIGLVAIGPLELFFPRAAYSVVGNWVWIVLLSLYVLVLLLIAFNMPPGILVYGIRSERFKKELEAVLQEQSLCYSVLGETVRVDSLPLHGEIREAGTYDIVGFYAIGGRQNLIEWIKLERSICDRISSVEVQRSNRGIVCIGMGLLIGVSAFIFLGQDLERLSTTISLLFE